MSPPKEPFPPEEPVALKSLKHEFSSQKSVWALLIILLASGLMLFSQHYLANPSSAKSEAAKSTTQHSPIDKTISLPILSQNEIEEALTSAKTPPSVKEALVAASHNKRLRLVKMPLQTDSTTPLPIEITTSKITQTLIAGPQVQFALLPIDQTGLVTIKPITPLTTPRNLIAFDNFGPFPLLFSPLKNTQITLLVISQ